MNKVFDEKVDWTTPDEILQEIWDAKEKLSSSYGHDLDRLVAITREHQTQSGRKVVTLEDIDAAGEQHKQSA
jgi:hypothetical protein